MRFTDLVRAISARAMFASHGVLAVWSVHMVFNGLWPFYLMAGAAPLLLETLLCITLNGGREWGRFCPGVACYLIWVLPTLWTLEQVALYERMSKGHNCSLFTHEDIKELTANQWVETSFALETTRQIILLVIIISRWLMPRGHMTHDQLSQLLLAYTGVAADITDFRAALRLRLSQVRCDEVLNNAMLALWSLSLLQFTVRITPSATISHQTGLLSGYLGGDPNREFQNELIAAVSSIAMQDCPFLVARTTLMVVYNIYQPSIIFFMFKNVVGIIIMVYRLTIVNKGIFRREERKIEQLLLARDLIISHHYRFRSFA
ncbi:hypothetical protein BaRGS_00006932 [Batillaria attramentaria]|uniref:Uncharacterized protein n=1 Tax=Batillaria attramentaria TaxID=370345 RepID=A0ABD0LRR2_9CAEN